MAADPHLKSRAVQIGDHISDRTSKLFAHPYMQVGVILFCIVWFVLGLRADLLTAALSILAITLTQMVLNGQYDREAEAHRRDLAMHAKIDELIISVKGARNEMVGIEDLDEADIQDLKAEVTEAIEVADSGEPTHRAAVKRAAQKAVDHEIAEKRAEKRAKAPRRSAAR